MMTLVFLSGQSKKAHPVNSAKTKACCALSHQLKIGICRCSTGINASTVEAVMDKCQPHHIQRRLTQSRIQYLVIQINALVLRCKILGSLTTKQPEWAALSA